MARAGPLGDEGWESSVTMKTAGAMVVEREGDSKSLSQLIRRDIS